MSKGVNITAIFDDLVTTVMYSFRRGEMALLGKSMEFTGDHIDFDF